MRFVDMCIASWRCEFNSRKWSGLLVILVVSVCCLLTGIHNVPAMSIEALKMMTHRLPVSLPPMLTLIKL